MSTKSYLNFLYSLQSFGIKLGLRNIELLLKYLGNPHRTFPSVHIAGTNGKGSTASMIAAMLTASGYRTGLYTSPHLVNFSERIRIDVKEISDERIAEYTEVLKPQIKKLRATFFEATTAMAFRHFADESVDIAVIETGLGGRFDATNVVHPLLSIITNIGIEHTEHLGSTHAQIAYEKGGIIKQSVPCFTRTSFSQALQTLQKCAKNKNAQLAQIQNISTFTLTNQSLQGIVIDLQTRQSTYDNLHISLAGEHQAGNAQLAVCAVEYLKSKQKFQKITMQKIRKGLNNIRRYSGLRGRIDVIEPRLPIIADVAHNPDSIKALINSLKKVIVGKVIAVFGVMKDKDYRSMIASLASLARLTIAVQPKTERALDWREMVSVFHQYRKSVLPGKTVETGINLAKQERRDNEPILVVGSHYTVSETMQYLLNSH